MVHCQIKLDAKFVMWYTDGMEVRHMAEQDDLLTAEAVGAELQVTVQTVRRWIRDGVLPGRRIGLRQWRVKRSDLRRFVDVGPEAVRVNQ